MAFHRSRHRGCAKQMTVTWAYAVALWTVWDRNTVRVTDDEVNRDIFWRFLKKLH